MFDGIRRFFLHTLAVLVLALTAVSLIGCGGGGSGPKVPNVVVDNDKPPPGPPRCRTASAAPTGCVVSRPIWTVSAVYDISGSTPIIGAKGTPGGLMRVGVQMTNNSPSAQVGLLFQAVMPFNISVIEGSVMVADWNGNLTSASAGTMQTLGIALPSIPTGRSVTVSYNARLPLSNPAGQEYAPLHRVLKSSDRTLVDEDNTARIQMP